jgi:hypothetical protein
LRIGSKRFRDKNEKEICVQGGNEMPTQKNVKTPELLYEYFEKYKKYCKKNPKQQNYWNSKAGKQVSVDREVPYTWSGFEIWLRKNGILAKLDDYKADKGNRYSKYADIIRAINSEIYEDKITGAMVGIYQHNIVARELGLIDKKDMRTQYELSEQRKKDIQGFIEDLS